MEKLQKDRYIMHGTIDNKRLNLDLNIMFI